MSGALFRQSTQGLFNGRIYVVLRMNVVTILFYEFLYLLRGHMTFVFGMSRTCLFMKFASSFR